MTTQAPDLNSPAAARAGIAAGVLAYIIWGLMPIYWRLLGEASSLEILCLRIIGSLVFIFGYLAAKGRPGELSGVVRGLRSDRPLALLLVGAAFFSSANWLVNIVGVNTGHVVELGIGMFLTPLMSVALGVVFFREKLTPIQWISVLLPLVGVLIMIWGLGRIPWIAILVSSTWAVYSAIKKKVPLSAWISLAVEHALMLIPAALYLMYLERAGGMYFLHGHGVELDLALLFVGFVTAIPMIAFSYAAPRLPMLILGFIQYLNPILVTSLGVLFFGESLTRTELIPLLFIWSGIAIYLASSIVRNRRALRLRPPKLG